MAGQEQVALYVKGERSTWTGAGSSGSIGVLVVDPFQLPERREPPVRIASQSQIAAVFDGLVPAHIFTGVFPSPHQASGWIGPILTHLSLLLQPSVLLRGLSARDHGDDR